MYIEWLLLAIFKKIMNFSVFSSFWCETTTMRFIHFIIFVCALSFSIQNGSCNYIFDMLEQAIHTKIGVIKDLPKRIPTLSEIFEFGKNILLGVPLEIMVNIIHEFCKLSIFIEYHDRKTNTNRLPLLICSICTI